MTFPKTQLSTLRSNAFYSVPSSLELNDGSAGTIGYMLETGAFCIVLFQNPDDGPTITTGLLQ